MTTPSRTLAVVQSHTNPFVYVRQHETIHSAVIRHRRQTGHAGWCIISRCRRRKAA